jgi:hypothetical protein
MDAPLFMQFHVLFPKEDRITVYDEFDVIVVVEYVDVVKVVNNELVPGNG